MFALIAMNLLQPEIPNVTVFRFTAYATPRFKTTRVVDQIGAKSIGAEVVVSKIDTFGIARTVAYVCFHADDDSPA